MTRADRVALAVGFLAAAAADRGVRQGTVQLWRAVWELPLNPPLEWEDADTGTVDHTDRVTRRLRWQITRPGWTYRVGTYRLRCGCSRSLLTGRMALYRWRCPIHSLRGA